MRPKKYLRFYGTHPENYDKEVQDRIASTPADKVQKDLRKYHTAVGVDFYNMGRKPKLDDDQQRQVKEWAKEYPKNLGKIIALTREENRISISERTS